MQNSAFADFLENLRGLLNVNQVAELLGVHRDAVYRWVRAEDLPAMNMGRSKTVLRFCPKDLAAWVRDNYLYFHGPSRFITDWMEGEVRRRGGPRSLLPPLPKLLELIGYDWLAEARRFANNPSLASSTFKLMDDFREAVQQLSLQEQRQLIEDIKSGKVNGTAFECEDAE